MGTAYSGTSVGGTDGSSQISLSSRHASMLSASQEAEIGGYRAHPSAAVHYGGQYGSLYGSAALSGTQQVDGLIQLLNAFYLLIMQETFAVSILTARFLD